jgi:tetratricopeptide (TPR) repeat protein
LYDEAGPLALAEARKAVAIDPNDSETQAALAVGFVAMGNLDGALEASERAIELNRNSAWARETRGGTLVFLGRIAEGRDECEIGLRLNPRDPASSMAASIIVQSYYLERRYAECVAAARHYLANYAVHPTIRRALLAALGQLGQREEAAIVLREWEAGAPEQFRLMAGKRPRVPFMSPEDYQHLNDGLRKAGLAV